MDPLVFTKNVSLTFGSNIKKYLRKRPPDYYFFSENGSQFKIHRELLGQNAYLRQILNSAKYCGFAAIEICCPCSDKELQVN